MRNFHLFNDLIRKKSLLNLSIIFNLSEIKILIYTTVETTNDSSNANMIIFKIFFRQYLTSQYCPPFLLKLSQLYFHLIETSFFALLSGWRHK